MNGTREVVGLRNVGKFLQKFFENQRLFQWLFVKRTKISDKNLNIWNFSDFLQKLKIFVNKNTIKMKNIKMYPLSTTFFSDISATFWKIPAKIKMPTTSLILILQMIDECVCVKKLVPDIQNMVIYTNTKDALFT